MIVGTFWVQHDKSECVLPSPAPVKQGRGLAFSTFFGTGKPTNTLSRLVSEKATFLLGSLGSAPAVKPA